MAIVWSNAVPSGGGSHRADSGIFFSVTIQATDGDTLANTSGDRIELWRTSDDALLWQDNSFATLDDTSGSSFLRDLENYPYGGPPLVEGTAYYWTMVIGRQISGGSIVGWPSPEFHFIPVINEAPTCLLLSPTDGAQVGTNTPTLSFAFTDTDDPVLDPDGARFDAYQLQVRRNSDNVLFLDTGVQTTTTAEKDAKSVSYLYDGTALVSSTTYKWRARVLDGVGAWSDFTAYRTFTPETLPNPPTITSPDGLTNTLTPTVQGTYNQGNGSAEESYQYQVRQGSVTIYDSGEITGAFGTGQAYGTDNPSDTPSTPPALDWGTNYQIRARSKDDALAFSDWSAWQDFNTNSVPQAPSGLAPADGAVLGDTTPRLSWIHNDPDGDVQDAAKIELRDVDTDTAVTGYDPKEDTSGDQFHDVTETLTDSPATEYKFRVQTSDGIAGYGIFSDWKQFTIQTAPTVTLTVPTPDQVVTGSSLTVEWTFSGGSGTQQDWRVIIFAEDQSTIIYDSNVQAGTDLSHTIPVGTLQNGVTYHAQVIARDTNSLEGQSSKVRFSATFTPPGTITGLTVQFFGGDDNLALPQALVSWDQTSLALSDFEGYRVYRKRTTDSEWTLIHETSSITDTSYQDFTFDSAVQQDWAVTQLEGQDGSTVESEKGTPVQGTLSFHYMFIHSVPTPGVFVPLLVAGQRVAPRTEMVLLQPFDLEQPIAHVAPQHPEVVEVQVRGLWPPDSAEDGRNTWTRLEALLAEQRAGSVLMVRQAREVRMFCQLVRVERSDSPAMYDAVLSLQEVFFEEVP